MKKNRLIKWLFLIFSFIALLIFIIVFYITFTFSKCKIQAENESDSADTCLYHVIVTGTYENLEFLQKVYKGASQKAESYNALVDLSVPQSQADTTTLQNLLDYASFLNADGIIAYIDSPDLSPTILRRAESPGIPFVTIGNFSANIHQISFIGTNNWEMGKKIGEEARSFLPQGGNVFIVNSSHSINSNNFISSLLLSLQESPNIQSTVIEKLSNDFVMSKENNIFICITEDDTIKYAQILYERYASQDYKLIGYGSNEVCTLYLQRGWITELYSLDPEKIGQMAIRELFEYRSRGYTNSYVIADVKIVRGQNQ